MRALDLETLAGVLGGDLVSAGGVPRPITGLSTDSRRLAAGDLYVAIRGERYDGHDFVTAALAQGAAGCLVDRRHVDAQRPAPRPRIAVDDTIAALGAWAHWQRARSSYRVIGITGSAGKTTTRQMIAHVLGRSYRVWQSPKNYNNLIGLPLTLLQAPRDTEVVVAELGTNRPGEIARLSAIAEPDAAVVTLAAPAHLAGFGSLAGIVEEKLSIRRGLRSSGALFVNRDCLPLWDGCRQRHLAPVYYGRHAEARFRAEGIALGPDGSAFQINGTRQVRVPLPGPAHVSNALACWAVCSHLGIPPGDIAAGLADLPPIAMRGECLQCGSLTVLNDCYNANPASMVNALQTMSLLDVTQQRRRVFVCGAMMELGADSERLHRELGSAIAEAGIDLVLAAGPLAAAAAAAGQTLRPTLQICRYRDGDTLCASLADVIREQDLILVKGSRSARLERAVAVLQEQFTPKASLQATNE
jgi:UDP-N-acetylmuramoyl-tripeptide--D-alanyl-D-alanine ligase